MNKPSFYSRIKALEDEMKQKFKCKKCNGKDAVECSNTLSTDYICRYLQMYDPSAKLIVSYMECKCAFKYLSDNIWPIFRESGIFNGIYEYNMYKIKKLDDDEHKKVIDLISKYEGPN